jgi:hypothetical protein
MKSVSALLVCLLPAAALSPRAHWEAVVHDAYDRLYRPLRSVPACNPVVNSQACRAAMYAFSNTSSPWWLRNALRDAVQRRPWAGLDGSWHVGLTCAPKVAGCLIEKVGSQSWKKHLSIMKNYSEAYHQKCHAQFRADNAKAAPVREVRAQNDDYIAAAHDSDEWLTFTWTRDPLERFLSAYINKCEHDVKEKHCEPGRENGDLFTNGTKSKSFAAMPAPMKLQLYIDVFPLRWNVHFFPQALYCDQLGLSHRRYSFVGNMNDSYPQQLAQLGAMVAARSEPGSSAWAAAALRTFGSLTTTTKRKQHANAHSTGASSKLLAYFNRHSVERLLAYYSIDYVELGLPLPAWLDQVPL